MLYALLCGCPPFNAEGKDAIFSQVLAGKVDLGWGPWKHISGDAKDLVLQMLTRDPCERITASQIKCEFMMPFSCPTKTVPAIYHMDTKVVLISHLHVYARVCVQVCSSFLSYSLCYIFHDCIFSHFFSCSCFHFYNSINNPVL